MVCLVTKLIRVRPGYLCRIRVLLPARQCLRRLRFPQCSGTLARPDGLPLLAWVIAALAFALCSPSCRQTPKTPPEQVPPPVSAEPVMPRSPGKHRDGEPSSRPPATIRSAPVAQSARHDIARTAYQETSPYRVDTVVFSPDDPQAGWLRILALDKPTRKATVSGVFPRQNVMQVDTDNVGKLSIDLSMLPIKPRRQIIVQLDRQGIELSQRHRGRVVLQRSHTGLWTVLTPIPRE